MNPEPQPDGDHRPPSDYEDHPWIDEQPVDLDLEEVRSSLAEISSALNRLDATLDRIEQDVQGLSVSP